VSGKNWLRFVKSGVNAAAPVAMNRGSIGRTSRGIIFTKRTQSFLEPTREVMPAVRSTTSCPRSGGLMPADIGRISPSVAPGPPQRNPRNALARQIQNLRRKRPAARPPRRPRRRDSCGAECAREDVDGGVKADLKSERGVHAVVRSRLDLEIGDQRVNPPLPNRPRMQPAK
jgi:hypothetical protein